MVKAIKRVYYYRCMKHKMVKDVLYIRLANGNPVTSDLMDLVIFSNNRALDLKKDNWVERTIKGVNFLLMLT